MIRKAITIITCTLLFVGATAFTKSNALLVGLWKYESMELPDSLKNDPDTKAALELVSGLMNGLTLEFKKDGTYEMSILDQSSGGKYKYNSKQKSLSMTGAEEDGGKSMFSDAKLMKLDKTTLVIGDKQGNITFKRY